MIIRSLLRPNHKSLILAFDLPRRGMRLKQDSWLHVRYREAHKSLSIITPPPITEKIVEAAFQKGIQNLWMQPGAESELAVKIATEHGMNIISGGPCVLVVLGYREVWLNG